MAETNGYLVQLQSPEGDNVYPIISAEMIKDAEGNTYNLPELFQSVSEGKSAIAAAVTDKGVTTAADATFQQIATNIGSIFQLDTSDANALAAQILYGQTAYVNGSKVTGTMPNNGAVSQALNCGASYTIPAGYHNGSGVISANSLASQTSATATAAQILSGYTAWVNGSKLTGTAASMPAGTAIKTVTFQKQCTFKPSDDYSASAFYNVGFSLAENHVGGFARISCTTPNNSLISMPGSISFQLSNYDGELMMKEDGLRTSQGTKLHATVTITIDYIETQYVNINWMNASSYLDMGGYPIQLV